jgi:hypothetical protein
VEVVVTLSLVLDGPVIRKFYYSKQFSRCCLTSNFRFGDDPGTTAILGPSAHIITNPGFPRITPARRQVLQQY